MRSTRKTQLTNSNPDGCLPLSGCGCGIAYMVGALALGGWSVQYCLDFFTGKTVDNFIAVLAGLFLMPATLPLAIICYLLRLCGVHTPILN